MFFPEIPQTPHRKTLSRAAIVGLLTCAVLTSGVSASEEAEKATNGYVIRLGQVTATPGSLVEVPITLYRGDDAIMAGQAAAAIGFEIYFDTDVLQFSSVVLSSEIQSLYGKDQVGTAQTDTGGQEIIIFGLNDTEITSYDGPTLIRPFPIGTVTFGVVGDVGDTTYLEIEELVCAAGDAGATQLTMAVGQNGLVEVVEQSTNPGGCGKTVQRMGEKVTEEVLPLSLAATPQGVIDATASPAIRLTSTEAIDPGSAWASLTSDGASIAGEASFIINGPSDGWVVFTPGEALPAGAAVMLTAGATTVSGEVAGPVSECFRVGTGKVAASHSASLVAAPAMAGLPELLAAPASAVYRLGPDGVFAVPVTVQIPIPNDLKVDDLCVYYFSESARHCGWYQGANVAGWMVPDSLRVVEQDGQAYAEFHVNHSGVIQLGTPFEVHLGSMGDISLGAQGSKAHWAVLFAVLCLLSMGLGALRAAYLHNDCR